MRGAIPIHPDHANFIADPFLLEDGNETWLFVEEWDETQGCGHLAAAQVLAGGEVGPRREILRRPYHLSYPFVSDTPTTFTFYLSPQRPNRWISTVQSHSPSAGKRSALSSKAFPL